MDKNIIKRPIILIVILCVLGIIFAYLGLINPFLFFIVFALLAIYSYTKDAYDKLFILVAGLIFIFSFFSAYNKLNYTPEINNFNEKEINITGQIISPSVEKNGRTQIYIKNSSYSINGKSYSTKDKILINIYSNKNQQNTNNNYKPGDYYEFKGKVKVPPGRRNYGGFNYNLYLKTISVNTYINVSNNNAAFIKSSSLPLHIDKLYNLKKFFQEKIQTNLDNKNKSDLIMGIMFSDKGLSEEISKDFSLIGISHILSVSGLHIGMIYIILELLLRFTGVCKKNKIFIITPILIFYIIMAGMSASAIRAGILCIVNMIVSLDEKHDNDLLNYLLLTMLIMLILNPLSLFNISFQLSFLAVIGIILFGNIMTKKLPEMIMRNTVLKFIFEIIIVSISASILTLPVLVNSFSGISLISIITNIIITPLVSIIMIISTLAVILSFTPIGIILFTLLSAIITYILSAANYLASLQYGFLSIQYMHIQDIILYLSIIFVISPYVNLKNRKLALLSIVILAICTGINIYNVMPKDYTEVHFLDVGQGNCSIVITPERKCLMFDGGGNVFSDYNTGENTIKPFLSYFGINKIDAVFISHTDADHVKGIYEMKDIIPINNVIVGYLNDEDSKEISSNIKAKIIKTNKTDVYNLGDVKISTINETNKTNSSDNNEKSVVFMLEYKGEKIIYPGDMTENIAKEIITDSSENLNAGIMDSAHHGSYYKTIDNFIEVVSPNYCIIQAGNNNYNLPNPKFLELLIKKDINYYITKNNGGIHFKIKGKNNIEVNTLLEE